ncbi:MAG: helix-hairpin-helix domain-containing protein [Ginsengibacter sp.]
MKGSDVILTFSQRSKMWKAFLREYLYFTRKERTGIFLLLFLILTCILFPFFFHLIIHPKTIHDPGFEKEMESLQVIGDDSADGRYANKRVAKEKYFAGESSARPHRFSGGENFNFDPNTTSVEDWERLGIHPKTVQTIQKYISKGGHFYHPVDIRKIWGLHEDDIKRLLPYVRINNPGSIPDRNEPWKHETFHHEIHFREQTAVPFDINSADTTLFISLPGIGSKLAQRIISFRDKLGGFASIDQVGETFGLPDSTFQKIKPKLLLHDPVVKKLNINSAGIDEMKLHPYIRYNIANAIFQYRTQHGNFNSVEELLKIMPVTPEVYSKLLPYLTIR